MRHPRSSYPPAALAGAALLAALAVACSGGKPTPQATVAATPTPTPVTCPASASWVTSPSQPDFSVDPSDHCGFYQYAWQSFLYLTSPSGGPGSPANFETWETIDEVFPSTSTTLKASTTGKTFSLLDKRFKSARKRVLRQRINKHDFSLDATSSQIGGEDQQAGSKGILVDQAGNITYYEQFFDPTAVNFFDACTLTTKACWTAPGASGLRFPNGSIELKVSWRPLWKTTPNVETFYTIPGSPVQNAAGQTVTPDFFGLVGFHLVYSIPNHPELVWATFEHVANSPDGPCTNGQNTCGQLPAGFTGWSYNNCKSTSCTGINTWPSPVPSPIPNAQVFLNYPQGNIASITDAAGVSGATNIALLNALNSSMLSVLPAGSVWRNYTQLGAIWTFNGSTGGALPAVSVFSSTGTQNTNANVVGSTFLANATMETFTQFPNPIPSPYPSPAPVQSCFTCHNTGSSTTPSFNVSHAAQAAAAGNCSWSTTPPAACTATQTASTAAAKK